MTDHRTSSGKEQMILKRLEQGDMRIEDLHGTIFLTPAMNRLITRGAVKVIRENGKVRYRKI